jgi:hypothetical protein
VGKTGSLALVPATDNPVGVVQWMHEMLVRRLVRLEQSRSGEVHVLVVDDKRSPKVGHRCLL